MPRAFAVVRPWRTSRTVGMVRACHVVPSSRRRGHAQARARGLRRGRPADGYVPLGLEITQLQVNTPSARRLHFWRLLDGSVELGRIVLHDDVEP
jgi:hypothetical protein